MLFRCQCKTTALHNGFYDIIKNYDTCHRHHHSLHHSKREKHANPISIFSRKLSTMGTLFSNCKVTCDITSGIVDMVCISILLVFLLFNMYYTSLLDKLLFLLWAHLCNLIIYLFWSVVVDLLVVLVQLLEKNGSFSSFHFVIHTSALFHSVVYVIK